MKQHSRPKLARAWFRCACSRCVAVLFDSASGFYCRQCLRLAYACQRATKRWRSIDRAQSIRVRLGSANLLDEFPCRPRHMRRKRSNFCATGLCCCRPKAGITALVTGPAARKGQRRRLLARLARTSTTPAHPRSRRRDLGPCGRATPAINSGW